MFELIAEIGSVHDGSFGNALKLVDLSKEVGATAVKFQMHIAKEESLINAPKPYYFDGEDRFEYFKRTSFSDNQWEHLRKRAKDLQMEFVVSPFSIAAFNKLEAINVDAYKVASGEVTNTPLLEKMAQSGKKVYISSGMSSLNEIDEALRIFPDKSKIVIMQCTSMYPCASDYVGLNVIEYLQEKYEINVGFSDHTVTNTAALMAFAYGARTIEKHLTFSKKMYGSDAPYASEPHKFKELTLALNEADDILNNPVNKNELSNNLKDMKHVFEKSIVAKFNLKKGKILKFEDLAFKKPGGGLKPASYKELVGKKLIKDLKEDQLLKKEDFIL